MDEWKEFVKKLGMDNRVPQEEFFNRTSKFIKTKKHILLNPAGMGLGKTLATSKVISDSLYNYEFFFIANPTAPLKEVWSKELKDMGMLQEHIIWFSKSEMCIKKKYNPKFNESKDCNDDCEFVAGIWKNKEYSTYCHELLQCLKLPITPNKYYKTCGEDCCLLPICRLGLKTRKILIGDFFGVLNSEMFELVTKYREQNRIRRKSCLVIDEAHLLPGRAKEYLSKSLSFDKAIRELSTEINCDYLQRHNLKLFKQFKDTLKTLENIRVKLLNEIDIKQNTIRYSYNKFKEDYNKCKIELCFNFEDMINQFDNLAVKAYNHDHDDYEDEKEPYCVKFTRFLRYWKLKQEDENYSGYFQYSIKLKDRIKFFINCQDTSKFLKNKLKIWGKVILNSGTISDLDYFKHHTGLETLDVDYMPFIQAHSIKDNVIIHPLGNFIRKNREETYNKNKVLLQNLLRELSGRTIVFIQSKQDSKVMEQQIREIGTKVVNFCLNDDGFETKKTDFDLCMDEFNSLKEGVAIMNINGRVEGYNFKNPEDNTSVSNIIVYGYPFPKRGIVYDDEKEYLLNILKDKNLASKWIDYIPTLDRIHQACMRAKRNENDNPIIILWDNQFGKNERGYDYMPDDLKGQIVLDTTQLLNIARERDDKRKTNL